MSLGPEDRALIRRLVAEEIRRQTAGSLERSLPRAMRVVRPAPLAHGAHPPGVAASRQEQGAPSGPSPASALPSQGRASTDEARQAAHVVADTQVSVARTLEGALRDLDDLVTRAETLAEKIRSTLRRTEPSGRGR
ncbi:MAG TPA: hypothetical protein VIK90_04295 [Limnochordales bacterium]